MSGRDEVLTILTLQVTGDNFWEDLVRVGAVGAKLHLDGAPELVTACPTRDLGVILVIFTIRSGVW